MSQVIDMDIFQGILELDSPGTTDFSQGLIETFEQQLTDNVAKLEEAMKAKDLKSASRIAHFLKGSSASLGITKVRETCEALQHYGELRKKDPSGVTFVVVTADVAEKEMLNLLPKLMQEFNQWRQVYPTVIQNIKQR